VRLTVTVALARLTRATLAAQGAKVTSPVSKTPQTFLAIRKVVEYPTGNSDPIHRHNAHALCMYWKAQS